MNEEQLAEFDEYLRSLEGTALPEDTEDDQVGPVDQSDPLSFLDIDNLRTGVDYDVQPPTLPDPASTIRAEEEVPVQTSSFVTPVSTEEEVDDDPQGKMTAEFDFKDIPGEVKELWDTLRKSWHQSRAGSATQSAAGERARRPISQFGSLSNLQTIPQPQEGFEDRRRRHVESAARHNELAQELETHPDIIAALENIDPEAGVIRQMVQAFKGAAEGGIDGITHLVASSALHTIPVILGSSVAAIAASPAGPAASAWASRVGSAIMSADVEEQAALGSYLMEKGVDITNPDELEEAITNPGLMAEVQERARRGGQAVGLVEFVVQGVGSAAARRVRGGARAAGEAVEETADAARALPQPGRVRRAAAVGTELATESVGETSGELARQFAADEEISAGEAALEGIAGLGQSVFTTAIETSLARRSQEGVQPVSRDVLAEDALNKGVPAELEAELQAAQAEERAATDAFRADPTQETALRYETARRHQMALAEEKRKLTSLDRSRQPVDEQEISVPTEIQQEYDESQAELERLEAVPEADPEELTLARQRAERATDELNAAVLEIEESQSEEVVSEDNNVNRLSEATREGAVHLTQEFVPGRTSDVLPGIHEAPFEEQLDYTRRIQETFTDEEGRNIFLRDEGLEELTATEAIGYWQGSSSPLVVFQVPEGERGVTLTPESRQRVARSLANFGIHTKQDAVAATRPIVTETPEDADLMVLDYGRVLNQEDMNEVENQARATGLIEGEDAGVALIATPTGVMLLNTSGRPNTEFQEQTLALAEALPEGEAIERYMARNDGFYFDNDWSTQPNGEGYRQGVSDEGVSEPLPDYSDIREFIDEVNREFAESRGWGESSERSALRRSVEASGQPHVGLRDLAVEYGREQGFNVTTDRVVSRLSDETRQEVRGVFEAASDTEVVEGAREAYAPFIEETLAQYDAFVEAFPEVQVIPHSGEGGPYAFAGQLSNDLNANNRVVYYPTESGFGEGEAIVDHPMLADSGRQASDGTPMLVNDVFRVVHDLFGHMAAGNEFTPIDEEAAFFKHQEMYSPEALPALFTETIAQTIDVATNEANAVPLEQLNNAYDELATNPEQAVAMMNEAANAVVFSDQKPFIFPQEIVERVIEEGYETVSTEENVVVNPAEERQRLLAELSAQGVRVTGVEEPRFDLIPEGEHFDVADVVDSQVVWPEELLREYHKEGINPDRVKGVYWKGTIYVNPLHAGELREIIRHEVVHHGIRRTFGVRVTPLLEGVYASDDSRLVDIREEVEHTYRTRLAKIGDAHRRRMFVAEEMVARVAETTEAPSPVQRLYDFIRTFLRDTLGWTATYDDVRSVVSLINNQVSRDKRLRFEQNEGTAQEVLDPFFDLVQDIEVEPTTIESADPTQALLNWFGDSQVVDENGNPQVIYHGTIADFNEFGRSHVGSFLGRGIYASSNSADAAENYANVDGPDVRNRLHEEVIQLRDDYADGVLDPEVVEEIDTLRNQLLDTLTTASPNRISEIVFRRMVLEKYNEGNVMPLYGRMLNPFVLSTDTSEETVINTADVRVAVDLLFEISDDLVVGEGGVAQLLVELTNEEVLPSTELTQLMAQNLVVYDDESGVDATGEFVRRVIEELGYDGILDRQAGQRFSFMREVDEGTTHYVFFNPNQVKSAIGNRTFDLASNDVRFNLAPEDANDARQRLAENFDMLRPTIKQLANTFLQEGQNMEETIRSVMELIPDIVPSAVEAAITNGPNPYKSQVTKTARWIVTPEAFEEAKRVLRASLNNLGTGLDPAVAKAALDYTIHLVEKGVRNVSDYMGHMIEQFGDSTELRQILPDLFRRALGAISVNKIPVQLLTESPIDITPEIRKASVSQKFTVKNAAAQIEKIDAIREEVGEISSQEKFQELLARLWGRQRALKAPYKVMEYANDPSELRSMLEGLTDEQIRMVDSGIAATESVREAYESGDATPQSTMRLLMWGVLSIRQSPYAQESGFIRALLTGADNYIEQAMAGHFNEEAFLDWSGRALKGTPGAGATSNLNLFIKRTLPALTTPAKDGKYKGELPIDVLHSMLMNPEMSSRQIRREFFQLTEGPGLDLKILSFLLLMTGRSDVVVLDRVQFRHFWDSANRVDEFHTENLTDYSWPSATGKQDVSGGMFNAMKGPAGLATYEAIEDVLTPVVEQAYQGTDREGSLGRLHWESWVASSTQEVGHPTIEGVVAGDVEGTFIREGKWDTFKYGVQYGVLDGEETYVVFDPSGGPSRILTPEQMDAYGDGLRYITNTRNVVLLRREGFIEPVNTKSWFDSQSDLFEEAETVDATELTDDNRVFPYQYRVGTETNTDGNQERRTGPWVYDAEVNSEALSEYIQGFGRPITDDETRRITGLADLEGTRRSDRGPSERRRIVSRESFEDAKRVLREAGSQVSAAPFLNPEVWVAAVKAGTYIVQEGAIKFADFVDRLRSELGDSLSEFEDSDFRDLHEAAQAMSRGNFENEEQFNRVATEFAAEHFPSRQFTERVREDERLEQEIRELISRDLYRPITNQQTVNKIFQFIKGKSPDELAALALAENRELTFHEQIALGEITIMMLNQEARRETDSNIKEKRYRQAADVAERYGELGTEIGRALQAFSMYSRLDPASLQVLLKRQINLSGTKKKRRNAQKDLELLEAVRESNARAADEATTKASKKVKEELDTIQEKAAKILAKRIRPGEDLNGSERDSVQFFVHTLFQVARELGTNTDTPRETSSIAELGKAVREFSDLRDVWEQAKTIVSENYADDPAALQVLNEFLLHHLNKPASSRLFQSAINEALKNQHDSINRIAREHWTVVADEGRRLSEKIAEEANVSEEDADRLAAMIEEEFTEFVDARRQKILENRLKTQARSDQNTDRRELVDKLFELANLGAIGDEQYNRLLDEFYTPEELTAEQIEEIAALAEAAQASPAGFIRATKATELMAYIALQKGVSWADLFTAYWYANVLSGVGTHLVNIFGSFQNLFARSAAVSIRLALQGKPQVLNEYLKGMKEGMKKGAVAFRGTVKGRDILKADKYNQPQALEIVANEEEGFHRHAATAGRYVGRMLAAADMFWFETAKEARAYQLAAQWADEHSTNDVEFRRIMSDELHNTATEVNSARTQAEREVQVLDNPTEADIRYRTYEILERQRNDRIRNEPVKYAGKMTFTEDQPGITGALMTLLNVLGNIALPVPLEIMGREVGDIKLFRPIVPFVRVLMNVLSRSVDFIPVVGHIRAALPTGTFGGAALSKGAEDISRTERQERLIEATLGGVAFLALAALAELSLEDDDEDPFFAISNEGPSDYAQANQLRSTGWKPQTVKIGDFYFQYKETVLAPGLAAIGSWYDQRRFSSNFDEVEMSEKLTIALSGIPASFFNLSLLSTVGEWLDYAEDPARDPSKLIRPATGFVPAVGLQRDFATFFQPGYRDTGILGTFLKDTPVVKGYVGKPKLNVLGEEIKPNGWLERTPGRRFVSVRTDDPVWLFAAENNVFFPQPRGGVRIMPADLNKAERFKAQDELDKLLEVGDVVNDVFNEEDEYKYLQMRGQRLRSKMEEAIEDDTFADMDTPAIQELIDTYARDASNEAKREFLGLDQRLRDRSQKVDELIREAQERTVERDEEPVDEQPIERTPEEQAAIDFFN